jgi:hypothetical protein
MAECKHCKKRKFNPIDEMWSLHSAPNQSDGMIHSWLFCSIDCVKGFAEQYIKKSEGKEYGKMSRV